MANEQNLKPFTSDQSREEAVKNGRKGGEASGEARRDKKRWIALGERLLAAEVKNEDERKLLEEYGAQGEEATQEVAIVVNMIRMAKTNPVAFEKLMKYLGRYVEKTEADNTIKADAATLEEWKAMVRRANE